MDLWGEKAEIWQMLEDPGMYILHILFTSILNCSVIFHLFPAFPHELRKKKKRLAVPAFSQRQVTAKGRGSEVCNVLDPGSRNLTFSICRPNVVHLHGGEICDTQFFPTGPFGRLQNPQAHHWGVKEYFNAYYIELHLCPRKCCPVRNMGAWLGIVNLSPGLFPH